MGNMGEYPKEERVRDNLRSRKPFWVLSSSFGGRAKEENGLLRRKLRICEDRG